MDICRGEIHCSPHLIISGAMYRYVPVSPVNSALLLERYCLERPKSASRACPEASLSTLLGFMSQWMIRGVQLSRAMRPWAT